ncbi:hypothetical protein FIU87_15135 [Bacillus sp. THAF10]|nr:hypothetical protein FIU87_15135 [Bacillus sp. THAF10]
MHETEHPPAVSGFKTKASTTAQLGLAYIRKKPTVTEVVVGFFNMLLTKRMLIST